MTRTILWDFYGSQWIDFPQHQNPADLTALPGTGRKS
jgi:hypothetical protein